MKNKDYDSQLVFRVFITNCYPFKHQDTLTKWMNEFCAKIQDVILNLMVLY